MMSLSKIQLVWNDFMGHNSRQVKAFVEFEEAIANLRKVTGEGYVTSKVLVDELSDRFTEKQPEIASILCRYVAAGGDWSALNRHIFSKPLTYYQGKDISLSYYITTMITSAPES